MNEPESQHTAARDPADTGRSFIQRSLDLQPSLLTHSQPGFPAIFAQTHVTPAYAFTHTRPTIPLLVPHTLQPPPLSLLVCFSASLAFRGELLCAFHHLHTAFAPLCKGRLINRLRSREELGTTQL